MAPSAEVGALGTVLSLCLYEIQPELHSRVTWGAFNKCTDSEILFQLWVCEEARHGAFLKLYPMDRSVMTGIPVRRVKELARQTHLRPCYQ